jgi:hypothetical protein
VEGERLALDQPQAREAGGELLQLAQVAAVVGVPGHDVVADRGGEEDRRLLQRQRGHDRERVVEVLRRQRRTVPGR